MGEFVVENESIVSIKVYLHFCPRMSLSIPNTFQKLVGRVFFTGFYDNLEKNLGNYDRKNKRLRKGFKGTKLGKVVSNIKNNHNVAAYREMEKDMINYLLVNNYIAG